MGRFMDLKREVEEEEKSLFKASAGNEKAVRVRKEEKAARVRKEEKFSFWGLRWVQDIGGWGVSRTNTHTVVTTVS